jgi:hypothetical protein
MARPEIMVSTATCSLSPCLSVKNPEQETPDSPWGVACFFPDCKSNIKDRLARESISPTTSLESPKLPKDGFDHNHGSSLVSVWNYSSLR